MAPWSFEDPSIFNWLISSGPTLVSNSPHCSAISATESSDPRVTWNGVGNAVCEAPVFQGILIFLERLIRIVGLQICIDLNSDVSTLGRMSYDQSSFVSFSLQEGHVSNSLYGLTPSLQGGSGSAISYIQDHAYNRELHEDTSLRTADTCHVDAFPIRYF